MRFVAPARDSVSAETFDQPVFAGVAEFRDLLTSSAWPNAAALNARLLPLQHRVAGHALSFVPMESLTDASVHYETRIFRCGEIATRSDNWHDLLNALIWNKFPAIKSALNARQAEHVDLIGPRRRTRAQDAMTQFDEAGAVVTVRDRTLLALWDAHDWHGLFLRERQAWLDGRIAVSVFGHALLEHALRPQLLLVAKALVLVDEDSDNDGGALDARTADAILGTNCLGDPQYLRPLPLSGIAGWHRAQQDSDFYRVTPCFRPLRSGRLYPAPMLARA